MTKKEIFNELSKEFEYLSSEDIIKLLCDYFNSNELSGFVEHVKDEHGR